MRQSAIYLEGSQTWERPKPCNCSLIAHMAKVGDVKCKYCVQPEFGVCEDDDCTDSSPAPQWWQDNWKLISFLGYYHQECGTKKFQPV